MGLLCAFYFICALRTNVIFATIFLSLVIALGLLTAGHWQLAQAQADLAANINIVSFHPSASGPILATGLNNC